MFELLSYNYALSSGGRFIGKDILGQFFLAHQHHSRKEIRQQAAVVFGEHIHLVRPAEPLRFPFEGTITDNIVLLCRSFNHNVFWGLIVFVKAADSFNAVLIPILQQPEAVEVFLGFLTNEQESIQVAPCQLRDDKWLVDDNWTEITWIKPKHIAPF